MKKDCTDLSCRSPRVGSKRQAPLPTARGLRRINPHAAGIDLGSREHYVAVPEASSATPVRTFGCTTPDLHEMARYLIASGVTTVALESTGVYWVPVVQVLEPYGLEVVLVDAHAVKNVPGRKSDVQDCQWIQELHTFGLLKGAFRPQAQVRVLRSYWRHREGLVQSAAQQIQWMHKALEQMNLQLHKVLSDVTGVTGMAIIRALLAGERDPAALARLRRSGVKHPEPAFVKALTGDYQPQHLFALRQAVELYDVFHEKIAECDREIQHALAGFQTPAARPRPATTRPARPRRKNQPHFDLRSELIRITGVDLTAIDGIDTLTAQTVICEVGLDVQAFPSEKHFASWLGLCPNNRITGGRVRRTRTRKVPHRLATALRVAAQSLHRSKSALGAFYRRLRARLGPAPAITATAHKLARLIYRMLKYGMAYVDQGQQAYEQQHQQHVLRKLTKRARQLGYQLVSLQSGELVPGVVS